MKVSGCIFDMDGLMFDTERLAHEAMVELGQEWGIDLFDGIPDCTGINDKEEEKIYKRRFGEDFNYLEMNRKRLEIVDRRFAEDGIPTKQGLYELLEVLEHCHIPMALATSNDISVAERYLKAAGIQHYFTAVVSGNMVPESKPNPRIFQVAAQKIGITPSEIIVLEDSPNGIMAAAAGGFLPCMVPDLTPPNEEIKKLLCAQFDSLLEVIPFVQRYQGAPKET